MPCAPAVAIRSRQAGPASGGTRLEVSQRARLRKSPGCARASVWPIIPPIERPTQWVRAMPSAARSARASSASCPSVYAPAGASVPPWPRVS
ncbi:MAG: hypothetical protein A3D33_22070 [Candidatus Rokubacteria bacterium RIFCSPHIGHO2_02_FULL_73_26]|nr:MAG: hypothetical protein A3D33_22070 [Candidatus Rokubacteria bacterium RIFCSPHIGHO2_02_FULL_73_26]